MSNLVPMSAMQLKQQVNLIQEVMTAVMKDETHFGKIPGCPKPSLWKPGAEKLCMTFRLRPIIDNDRDIRIEDLGNGHREVTVYCHIMTADGLELATGVGSCSTMESKYRYRGGEKISTGQPVPKEYWNLKNQGKIDDALASIGGEGYGVAKFDGKWEICELGEKQENVDIADTYNTVLKMARKRAFIDGILSATAASDIFTQDLPGAEGEDDAPATRRKQTVNAPTSRKQQEAQKPAEQKPPQQDDVPPPSDSDAPQTKQGELIPDEIPNCHGCGVPVASDKVTADKVAGYCKSKGWDLLCRACQPKR